MDRRRGVGDRSRLVAEGGENSEGWDVQSIDLDGITATAAITRIE
jgi:hypothetical protein